jgi:hypothetical protein
MQNHNSKIKDRNLSTHQAVVSKKSVFYVRFPDVLKAYEIRDTLHASRDTRLGEGLRRSRTISSHESRATRYEYMQNKANVKIGNMNVSIAIIKNYDKKQ